MTQLHWLTASDAELLIKPSELRTARVDLPGRQKPLITSAAKSAGSAGEIGTEQQPSINACSRKAAGLRLRQVHLSTPGSAQPPANWRDGCSVVISLAGLAFMWRSGPGRKGGGVRGRGRGRGSHLTLKVSCRLILWLTGFSSRLRKPRRNEQQRKERL